MPLSGAPIANEDHAQRACHGDPGTVLASENTYRLSGDYFEFASQGRIRVKGKDTPVGVYRLLRPGEVETRLAAF